MSRTVFLSFLGTTDYALCCYLLNGKKSRVVKFVQNAFIELLNIDFDNHYIFCTDAAEENYGKLTQEGEQEFTKVKIPDGNSEQQIWEIFDVVFKQLKDDDEIVLDITHGFRSLPMLGIVLMQYAKFLKNIKVTGIYYGAFEVLGPKYLVEKNIPNPEDREAPIFDLTPFSALQDWTVAANNFIKLGNADKFAELANESVKGIGSSEAALIGNIATNLSIVSQNFLTNRGSSIYRFSEGVEIVNDIYKLEKSNILPPFVPIVHNIKTAIADFKSQSSKNIMLGVQWCVDKGLTQQGITQLQEGIITMLCEEVDRDFKEEENRNLISQYLQFGRKPKEKWKFELAKAENEDSIEILNQIEDIKTISGIFSKLTKARNDINHGGFRPNDDDFQILLNESFMKIKDIFNAPQPL
ncbi:CRISPR-associated protein, TM1812 family [Cruoricaptor ignavus]|uniref:CRISPR-associated protein, TM1812 family n=1 Tax=Cruoricaptor ignavus TaxID=1118202 RepID=A0A1M6DJY7_9FLAO|nr:TIGR02221 family CRISPR-associated protein [Cruoricaptor ignavus]SHI73480.1 CRISPR-associated protein, TM1812 family [Cruoricaptor ignavus]